MLRQGELASRLTATRADSIGRLGCTTHALAPSLTWPGQVHFEDFRQFAESFGMQVGLHQRHAGATTARNAARRRPRPVHLFACGHTVGDRAGANVPPNPLRKPNAWQLDDDSLLALYYVYDPNGSGYIPYETIVQQIMVRAAAILARSAARPPHATPPGPARITPPSALLLLVPGHDAL